MRCPACKSISPDDVRFCLHCGQYLGEPEEVTRVISPPPPAQTTIRAPEWNPVTLAGDDEPKNKKLSGLQVGGIVLVIALVLCAGIVIGVAIVTENGAPKNSTVAVVSTPTPIVVNSVPAFSPIPAPTRVEETPTPPPSPRPRPTSTEQTQEVYRPTPMPGGYEPAPPQSGYQPRPQPTRDPLLLGSAVTVINDSRMLKDGAWVSWQLPPGYYQLTLTSGPDGAAAQWVGTTSCDFKTQEMTRLTQRCKMESPGQLVISNPTRFGLGAAIGVAIRVTRF